MCLVGLCNEGGSSSIAYFDSSLQTVEITGSEYQAAGAAVTKGHLRILAQVHRQHGRDQMCRQITHAGVLLFRRPPQDV